MKRLVLLLLGAGMIASAHAGVYKSVDAQGRVTYSDVPSRGAVRIDIAHAPIVAVALADAPRIAQDAARECGAFARVSMNAESNRQRLSAELVEEEQKIAALRLAMMDDQPVVGSYSVMILNADGTTRTETRQGVALSDQRNHELEAALRAHQRKIDGLRRDLQRC